MRAARLIKMVLLLQARPSITGAELARELEVSERTVTRDAAALSEAGIPVYADRGRAGGYRLIGGYRTRLTGLGRAEAEALFLSGVPSALREMGLADAASAARLKVSAALLPELRDASHTVAQRFHLDAPGWWQEPQTPPLLPEVADAVWDDRRLLVRYRRRDTEVERELEPYGLVLKAGVWYLAARVNGTDGMDGSDGTGGADGTGGPNGTGRPGDTGSVGGTHSTDGPDGSGGPNSTDGPDGTHATGSTGGSGGTGGVGGAHSTGGPDGAGSGRPRGPGRPGGPGGDFRVYRVDRLTDVAPVSGGPRFVRDEAFDLPAFWAERAAQFARSILREEITLRLSPDGARRLPYVTDRTAGEEAVRSAGEPDGEGWITVTLPVESAEVAYGQLLALGPEAEVLSPAPLRERFATAARRMASRYR
ncbi:WYL domain-containing protein [Streptomyces sp. NPDC044780]|uniref:helix-turn-helix transcriptional regulator n=1 Tax=unclassified Streptomyces TaxID=2593676 RepID=UPI0033F0C585